MVKQNFLTKMLLLCALIVGSTSVWGQDPELSLDFTSSWTAGDNNSDGEKVFTKTIGDETYTISGKGGKNFKFSNGYFIFGQSGAYIKLPKVDYDVDKIVVIGNGAGSAAVKMNLFVGEQPVSTETTGCGEGSSGGTASTLTYNINTAYQSANTQYILKVTSSHNAQITYVKYYKKTGGSTNAVSIPIFNPSANTYNTNTAQEVEITCGTTGASIYYTMTTNGTTPADPTEQSNLYSSAIPITKTGTIIKAKAFKTGMDASSVATATFTIKPNAPTISAAGATVTITGDNENIFYYTLDGNTPTNQSTEYTGPFVLDADCTIKAISYDTYGNAGGTKSFTFKYLPFEPKNINSSYYVKVTDVSTLENGDAILIVNEVGKVAMSTTQNNNNRGQENVTISSEKTITSPSIEVQKLVLVKKTETIDNAETDCFYFYTGDGYLYAASNSSNHLKTEASPDNNNNARATISISGGDATITFTGTSSRNLLKYNSGDKIFSCYGSGQDNVQIYKEVLPPSVTITPAKEYVSFSSPYALDFTNTAGLTAYVVSDETSTSVTLTEVNIVPVNTGLVLKGTANTEYTVPVLSADAGTITNNKLKGTGTEGVTGLTPKSVYVLSDGKFKVYTGTEIAGGKAYLPKTSPAPSLSFDFGEGTTGIQNIERTINDNQYYTLDGRRVAEPTKGLYIINGKKVIIK